MLDVEKEFIDMNERVSQKMNELTNTHDKYNVINDLMEVKLEYINSQVSKEPFRNVDNTPKSLIHMTEEDLIPKSP